MYVLDSDIVSIIQDRRGPEAFKIEARLSKVDPVQVFVSIITFHEQANGWNNYIRQARKSSGMVRGYQMFERLLSEFLRLNILSFDDAAAKVFDEMKAQKFRVSTMDLRIAAVARSNDFTVVTRSMVDFKRVPGLRVEDWTVG